MKDDKSWFNYLNTKLVDKNRKTHKIDYYTDNKICEVNGCNNMKRLAGGHCGKNIYNCVCIKHYNTPEHFNLTH